LNLLVIHVVITRYWAVMTKKMQPFRHSQVNLKSARPSCPHLLGPASAPMSLVTS
jgi:hypothetical protein